jgi:peroxiredoxin
MPHLNAMSKKHAKRGLVVIGVTDEEKETITEFMGKNTIDYPLGLDAGRKVHKDYMITALPTLFVIDHKGVVREIVVGGGKKKMEKLDATIERLLNERAAGAK